MIGLIVMRDHNRAAQPGRWYREQAPPWRNRKARFTDRQATTGRCRLVGELWFGTRDNRMSPAAGCEIAVQEQQATRPRGRVRDYRTARRCSPRLPTPCA